MTLALPYPGVFAAPRWLELFATAGKGVTREGGKRGLLPGGKRAVYNADDECPTCCVPCTPSDVPCSHCDDVTPEQYTATFSGIQSCGCVIFGGSRSIKYTFNTDVNSSFTLSKSGFCQWSYTIANGVTIETYNSNTTCSGTPNFTSTDDLAVRLIRASTQWTLVIDTGAGDTFFRDIQSEDDTGVCATLPAFTSDYTAGSCSFASQVFGYGGTGTVECL